MPNTSVKGGAGDKTPNSLNATTRGKHMSAMDITIQAAPNKESYCRLSANNINAPE